MSRERVMIGVKTYLVDRFSHVYGCYCGDCCRLEEEKKDEATKK